MLEAVGVSETQERVYEALLDNPGASIQAVAKVSGVTARQAKTALLALETKGLVTRLAGDRPRFVPTAPDVAINVLVLQRQQELERTRLAAKSLVDRLRASRPTATTGELVELIMGKEAFWRRFMQLEQAATEEVLALDKPPYVTPARECNDIELERLAGGVRYRGIYDREALELPGSLEVVRRMVRAGEQARVMKGLPLKLAVADRKIGLIPLNVQPGREEAVVVHESPLLDALVTLFETLWDRAAPLRVAKGADQPSDRDDRVLSELDQRILTLLAAGFTDESAAAQVGVSQATVQRRVKRLMQMLGAQSRFQAGMVAAERGLLARATN